MFFINLSKGQEAAAVKIWKLERETLANMPLLKNENIAPVIYKSEIDFRKILTEDQLKKYPMKNTHVKMFLNNEELEELRRIYNL